MPPVDYDGDSIERPTILGMQHVNPYLIPNMQQAYANLGITNVTVNVTNLYVRFLPNSVQQLATLDSTLDNQGLDIFDAPMDYDVLQEGDYYQDPSIPDSEVTYQYAVVPPNFQFPSGIAYTVLAQIHIPADAYTAVETEAERLAAIQDSLNASQPSFAQVIPNTICAPGYHWDPVLKTCVSNCPAGYHWDQTKNKCVPDNPPPPPPPPAPDASLAAGYINVSDVILNNTPGERNVRIVAKRWFKIERLSTDNNGYFQSTKHFKHKVKIVVKFENSYCNIRGLRGLRIWNLLLPVEKTIGVYSGNKDNISFTFSRYNTNTGAKGNLYWVAATTNDAIQEHADYAAQFGFSPAPTGLNIYIINWGVYNGLSATPLFGKRLISDIPLSFVNTFFVGVATSITSIIGGITRARLDMVIDYHQNDIGNLTSDYIKSTVYHEASHGSQYSQMGTVWYTNFVNAELAETAKHPFDQYTPYGDGGSSNSPIIALGEAWGYHMGHFLADQRYGITASCQIEQNGGLECCNNNYTGHPHIDVLENFIHPLVSDQFQWIPKGLFWDLMDNGEPPFTMINDQVSGYTIQQIFAAYQPDVTTLQQYRDRLLQQNNNNQQTQILNLFQSYGYQ